MKKKKKKRHGKKLSKRPINKWKMFVSVDHK